MAKVSNYKAQFCRQYFTQLKGFIKSFYLTKDDLGMRFLLDAYDFDKKNSHKKNQAYWNLDIEVDDKHLMLAIEEYYAITNGNTKLQEQRDKLFKGLIEPDNYADDDLIKVVFVDQTTMLEISKYFGIEAPRDPDLDNQINKFEIFIGKLDHHDIKTHKWVSFKDYAKALHILRLHRNNKAHLLTKLDTPERKIALQFLAFMYIGLTYILRMAWREQREKFLEAKLYKEPKEFDMPVQKLKVIAKVKDSSDDIIYAYEFRQSLQEESVLKGENTNNEKETFERSFNVKKYDKFKIGITFGHSDHKETLWFEDMLSYYYWQPTFEINLPTVYSLKPGLELNVGNDKIEGLIAQLLDKTNRRNDGIAKDKESEIVNAILAGLEPVLQRISALSQKTDKSKKEEDEQNKLTDSVIKALQNQTGKLDDILSKINDVKDENNKQLKGLTKKLDDLSVRLMKKIQKISDDARQDKEAEVTSDRWKFFGKHWLPALTLLVASICIFGLSLTHDYSLCWLEKKFWWVSVFILLLVIIIGIMIYVDKTTVANRASIITRNVKWLRVGCLALTAAFFLGTILAVPNKSLISLVDNYDFSAKHDDGDNARAAALMEEYLEKEKPTDDEAIRISLAKYYLSYSNMKGKALEVTRPMRYNVQKYRNGALFAAEALYEVGDYRRVDDIIVNCSKVYAEKPAIINRLLGIMYCYGQHYDKDVQKGVELLKEAADKQEDIKAQYYLGHIYSHVMSEWSTATESTDTLFNLIRAIDYYKKSVDSEPKASIELGTLYADLNMKDDAKFYFLKAISESDDSLKMEAYYRMGMLLYDLGQKDNKYLALAKDTDYGPALLYSAVNEKHHQGAIDYYEAMGRYKGHRYIPPVVFEYIARGDKRKALDTLKATRRNGNFNEEFVDGMQEILISRDSIKGMELMKESAARGCKYAKMICCFRDLEQEMENGNYTLAEVNTLENLGNEIAFANILAALLLSEKALHLDSISDIKNTEPLYEKSAELAIKAINHRHPAGALVFSDARLLSYYFRQLSKDRRSKLSLKQELSIMYLMIRLLSKDEKQYFIMHASINDLELNPDTVPFKLSNGRSILRKVFSPKHRHFWSDIAIANDDVPSIFHLLNDTKQSDKYYYMKLYSAAMRNITNSSDNMYICDLSSRALFMKNGDFVTYIDSLKQIYRNDLLKSNILLGKFGKTIDGEDFTITYSSSHDKKIVSNTDILNEFSDIKDHIYSKPL